MSTRLAACIITYNEADRIGACLESLAFCDEIVVVDSGSTDGTPELAARLGARVLHREFDGYRTQKQFAVDQAGCDWVLCLDADEVVGAPLRRSIEAAQANGFADATGYRFARCSEYHGRNLRHGNAYPDRVLRLFDRRQAGWHGDREIHEHVVNRGATRTLAGDLQHYPYRSFGHELDKLRGYARQMAQYRFDQGKQPSVAKMLASPAWIFLRGYVWRLGFLDGWRGLVYHLNGATYSFHKELFLRDLHEQRRASAARINLTQD